MTVNDPIPAGALLIDLRDKRDYDAGHLPGARNLSVSEILEKTAKDQEILLYCYHGIRSYRAWITLRTRGYKNARSLGGLDQYKGQMVR